MLLLKNHSLTWEDVDYVRLGKYLVPKDNFEEVARNTNYNSGYGSAEIRTDLKIIGWNWWLERAEYDGAEWWELKTQPFIPNESRKIKSLKVWEEDEQSSFFPIFFFSYVIRTKNICILS